MTFRVRGGLMVVRSMGPPVPRPSVRPIRFPGCVSTHPATKRLRAGSLGSRPAFRVQQTSIRRRGAKPKFAEGRLWNSAGTVIEARR
jgi:hypothetical protein